MVSLRRRRLLGLCSGLPNSVVAPIPIYFDNEGVAQFAPPSTDPVGGFLKPFDEKRLMPVANSSPRPDSSNVSGSGSLEHQNAQHNIIGSSSSQEQRSQPFPDQEVKRRKRHKRKNIDQDQCVMRGVYFKNMKWQAAIKVDKKQIHLGTVGSQEEAAHLYDRAAFMCGREPNFELTEEEKQELRRYKWEEFLTMTRLAINSKKVRRRREVRSRVKPELSIQDPDFRVNQGVQKAEQQESNS